MLRGCWRGQGRQDGGAGGIDWRSARRRALRVVLGVVSLCIAYAGLLVTPGPFFRHAHAGTVISVHSDEAIPDAAGEIVRSAEARVSTSPLFALSRREVHDVYVCQRRWRWELFSTHGKGGAFATPLGPAVFTRSVHWTRNRLVGASGQESTGDRTIDYFLAHEVTHTLTEEYLGIVAMHRLPAWVREGYADYVGRGHTFDYRATREAFLRGDAELDPRASGLYLRYVLLVSHLLDREGWDVPSLLRHPPDRGALEQRIREDRPERLAPSTGAPSPSG
jgi:hypothetical protein